MRERTAVPICTGSIYTTTCGTETSHHDTTNSSTMSACEKRQQSQFGLFYTTRDAAPRPRAMTAAHTQLGDQRLRLGTAVPIWTLLYDTRCGAETSRHDTTKSSAMSACEKRQQSQSGVFYTTRDAAPRPRAMTAARTHSSAISACEKRQQSQAGLFYTTRDAAPRPRTLTAARTTRRSALSINCNASIGRNAAQSLVI